MRSSEKIPRGSGRLGQLRYQPTLPVYECPTRCLVLTRGGGTASREVMPDVTDLAVGWYHVLVWTSNGRLMTFGLNRFGQLGVEQNQVPGR